MTGLFVVGATGLVGAEFLRLADKSALFSAIEGLTRRKLPFEVSSKVDGVVETNSENWAGLVGKTKIDDVFFSGLGTTRAAAGGLANQYKIDHDLNLELAKAAKAKGFKTYVLISSGGANSGSYFPYLKMKGELDDEVTKLGFERTIIVRPGLLLGEREKSKGFFVNSLSRVGSWVHNTPLSVGTHSIYGKEVAAGVLKALEQDKKGVEYLSTNDLYALLKK